MNKKILTKNISLILQAAILNMESNLSSGIDTTNLSELIEGLR